MKTVMRLGLASIVLSLVLGLNGVSTVFAATPSTISNKVCEVEGNERLAGCESGDQKLDQGAGGQGAGYLESLVNVFLLAAGLVAIVFVIIGGVRYITSTGDPSRIKQAKDTLMYAVVGLIVVGLARAIIGYVIGIAG